MWTKEITFGCFLLFSACATKPMTPTANSIIPSATPVQSGAGTLELTASTAPRLFSEICVSNYGSQSRIRSALLAQGFRDGGRLQPDQFYDGTRGVSFNFGNRSRNECVMLFKSDLPEPVLRAEFDKIVSPSPIVFFNGAPDSSNFLYVAKIQ